MSNTHTVPLFANSSVVAGSGENSLTPLASWICFGLSFPSPSIFKNFSVPVLESAMRGENKKLMKITKYIWWTEFQTEKEIDLPLRVFMWIHLMALGNAACILGKFRRDKEKEKKKRNQWGVNIPCLCISEIAGAWSAMAWTLISKCSPQSPLALISRSRRYPMQNDRSIESPNFLMV